jgi:hypothetical protein
MCNKVKLSKEEARLFLKHNQEVKFKHRREKRMYFCEECEAWHTTSKDLDEHIVQDIPNLLNQDRWVQLLQNNL